MYSKEKASFSFTPFFEEIAYCQGPFPLEEYIKIIFNLYSIFFIEGIQKTQERLDFCQAD